MLNKLTSYIILTHYSLSESVYAYDCTFFKPICLSAKTLRRITMCGFLVGATEPDKCTLK